MAVALDDSDEGSSMPQAHRECATGTAKIPAATATSIAVTRNRLGAARASVATLCKTERS
jgi:hypothetical protein